jgi:hypothetical protein
MRILKECGNMNKLCLTSACLLLLLSVVGCEDKSTTNFVGTWQMTTESVPSFIINKTEDKLIFKTIGESSGVDVQVKDNDLIVDGTTFTYDEKQNQLSVPGLFNTKITFKKVGESQK